MKPRCSTQEVQVFGGRLTHLRSVPSPPPFFSCVQAGQTASSLYGLSGSSSSSSAYSSSSRGGSDVSRINEYRRSSLGPTAPVTTDYGRSPPSSSSYGYRRHDSGSSKRY